MERRFNWGFTKPTNYKKREINGSGLDMHTKTIWVIRINQEKIQLRFYKTEKVQKKEIDGSGLDMHTHTYTQCQLHKHVFLFSLSVSAEQ